MSKPGKKRIMVQVWDSLAKALVRDFKALHIKRDSLLNALFAHEIERLNDEVPFRVAEEAKARVLSRALPNRVKLTLELDEQVSNRIDEVLQDKNILRDSFVNRVFFFLVAKQSHLAHLGIEYDSESPETAKSLNDALGFLRDPFQHIRARNEGRFYTLSCFPDGPFGNNGPNLFALNTAIREDDWWMFNVCVRQPHIDRQRQA
jgi:hypothetical protein